MSDSTGAEPSPLLKVQGTSRLAFGATTAALVTLASGGTAVLVNHATHRSSSPTSLPTGALPSDLGRGGDSVVVDHLGGTTSPAPVVQPPAADPTTAALAHALAARPEPGKRTLTAPLVPISTASTPPAVSPPSPGTPPVTTPPATPPGTTPTHGSKPPTSPGAGHPRGPGGTTTDGGKGGGDVDPTGPTPPPIDPVVPWAGNPGGLDGPGTGPHPRHRDHATSPSDGPRLLHGRGTLADPRRHRHGHGWGRPLAGKGRHAR